MWSVIQEQRVQTERISVVRQTGAVWSGRQEHIGLGRQAQCDQAHIKSVVQQTGVRQEKFGQAEKISVVMYTGAVWSGRQEQCFQTKRSNIFRHRRAVWLGRQE